MIVKFSTRYGQLTMLGEAAVQLIRLMGHSGTVPGAILSGELPAALARLRAALADSGTTPSPEEAAVGQGADEDQQDDEASRPPAVTLGMRAVPLLDMIDTAIRSGDSDLMWERG
ncbi:MAG TPA: DUF1840 domain-containing protein [Steroidobacteraceae bacterium]|nr:DUF1840 domain-containing protein [Steroidobacteraceae bacterium]